MFGEELSSGDCPMGNYPVGKCPGGGMSGHPSLLHEGNELSRLQTYARPITKGGMKLEFM